MGLWAVTGIRGFIGSNLLTALTALNTPVRGLVRNGGGQGMVTGSLADRKALQDLVAGADVVVHLAGYVHRSTASQRERDDCRATNVTGTQNLIQVMNDIGSDAFLIFVSTSNVYRRSENALDEETPPEPQSFYGETKLEAERLVLRALRTGTLRGTILRPAMVFGPGDRRNLGRLVAMVRRGIVPTMQSGRNRKSLLPIETLVRALTGVAEHRISCNGEIFNVSVTALTMRQITDVIADALSLRVRHIPLPMEPCRAAGHIVDTLSARLRLGIPSLRQMVETYASSSVIDDARLRSIIPLVEEDDLEAALYRTAIYRGPSDWK